LNIVSTQEQPGNKPYKEDVVMRVVYSFLIAIVAAMIAGGAHAQEIGWKKVDEALGKTAAVSGDVHRYGLPRTDLTVTLDGVTIKPTLVLGGWVAFQPRPMHGAAMDIGDLVLFETEINRSWQSCSTAASTSRPFITICCAQRPPPSTCMSAGMATP
jgi:uncharacterized protein DUF1259